MTPPTLLADLQAAGFRLSAREGKLVVWPGSKLSTQQRQAVETHRDGLMALINPPGGCPYCRKPLDGPRCWRCSIAICPCGATVASPFILVCRSCEIEEYRRLGIPY